MVVEGETGLLTDERRPEHFADALLEMLKNGEMRAEYGAAGQERARELFAKEETAGSLVRYIASHGDFNRDSELKGFFGAFLAQRWRRFLRKWQRKAPSKYVLIERERRAARKKSGKGS